MELTVVIAVSSIFFNGLIGLLWWSVKQKIVRTNNNFSKLFSSIEDLKNSLISLSKDIGNLQGKQQELEKRLNNQSNQMMRHLELITEIKTKQNIIQK